MRDKAYCEGVWEICHGNGARESDQRGRARRDRADGNGVRGDCPRDCERNTSGPGDRRGRAGGEEQQAAQPDCADRRYRHQSRFRGGEPPVRNDGRVAGRAGDRDRCAYRGGRGDDRQ